MEEIKGVLLGNFCKIQYPSLSMEFDVCPGHVLPTGAILSMGC